MTVQKKQKSKSITEAYARTVVCEYCNKTHRVQERGWAINGRGTVLCHTESYDCCFVRNYQDSKARGME